MGKNKKRISIASIICVLFLAGIMAYMIKSYVMEPYIAKHSSEWAELSTMEEYEKLFESPIVEIRLREAVDSAEWAVFSDDDLIEKWENFLKEVKVKKGSAILEPNRNTNGGGGLFADITTETSNFGFCFYNDKIETNNAIYNIESDIDVPFTETFYTAIERHGITTPWD